MKTLRCLLIPALAGAVHAETVYKVVGPDGKTSYTDRPPADGKSATTLEFADAPSSPLPESVLKYQAELLRSMKSRGTPGAPDATPTLYSAKWCGYCKKAKAWLAAKNINYREYDIDTPDGARAYFEAGGKRGVPLLLVDGKRLQGFNADSYGAVFGQKK